MCFHNNCDQKEDIYHYLFECTNYFKIREDLFDELNDIYNDCYDISFYELNKNEKLKFVLYPFQDEFKDKQIHSDDTYKKQLINLRIQVIKIIMNYIEQTERFKDEYCYNTYFTF